MFDAISTGVTAALSQSGQTRFAVTLQTQQLGGGLLLSVIAADDGVLFLLSSTVGLLLLQEQQQLLATYQSLVVKQLVSQSQSRKQQQQQEEEAEGEADATEEQNEEARSVRAQLMSLTPQVKDLVLSQKKTPGTEE